MRQWVSDQGANFPNQMVDILQRTIAAQHHFTAVYTPWIKALLSEPKLPVQNWSAILRVVEAALDGMPADRLGAAEHIAPP
ncbi:hypothetical protein GN244_ATG20690 [Phytophthora infestans]|uniref:Uncharacterized protein n=1 Tax=Phytophthora infestans TaxID=4787 RepID=A0A833SD27_PHYIN|nr:hypothetical protein GN244_ATG20690 [Phytophthora infestans]